MLKVVSALIAIVSVTVSVGAMACPQDGGEAQYSGRVINTYMIQHDKVECVYQIEFSRFDANPSCPIDQVAAESTQFRDASCSLSENQNVSGYLIEKSGGGIQIEGR